MLGTELRLMFQALYPLGQLNDPSEFCFCFFVLIGTRRLGQNTCTKSSLLNRNMLKIFAATTTTIITVYFSLNVYKKEHN